MIDKINGAIMLIQDVLHDTQDKDVIEDIKAILDQLDDLVLDKPDDEDYSDPNDEHRLTGKQLGVVK